ncbi:hypothetical protein MTR_4g068365 [Medicago truncatula]|uniref:Uncharacterized protein n=1 Tax=Medicago truncatula TaxID=3880 RepID=A0A072UMW1_MEDTR|nr:hypothetical protein MTR_4g068365 [Medicago truncatula]
MVILMYYIISHTTHFSFVPPEYQEFNSYLQNQEFNSYLQNQMFTATIYQSLEKNLLLPPFQDFCKTRYSFVEGKERVGSLQFDPQYILAKRKGKHWLEEDKPQHEGYIAAECRGERQEGSSSH